MSRVLKPMLLGEKEPDDTAAIILLIYTKSQNLYNKRAQISFVWRWEGGWVDKMEQ